MAYTCPYCRTEVDPSDGSCKSCEGCGTPHHVECYEENGGCTLFGCRFAPTDDPKIAVTSSDVLQTSAMAAAAGVATAPAYAPSPFGDVNAMMAPAPSFAHEPPPPPPPPPTVAPTPAQPPQQEYSITGTAFLTSEPVQEPKKRLTFFLLGVFLGPLGAHNFYAGFKTRAILQLCLTVLTLGYASFVAWLWAIVEVCTVSRDCDNIEFV